MQFHKGRYRSAGSELERMTVVADSQVLFDKRGSYPMAVSTSSVLVSLKHRRKDFKVDVRRCADALDTEHVRLSIRGNPGIQGPPANVCLAPGEARPFAGEMILRHS